ncbi:cyclic nucleotide-binding domain-containing protein [Fontimonas sp. SYSU GA230001]|uniref:Crp/Fnr family transcriptional regulator n=1 Tax=Fontimonas sp. SYSU GA230001 TaxID=3142450 RepID=UPI0032B54D20
MDRRLLQDVYLFREFSEDELAGVEAIAQRKAQNPGDVLFNEGDAADALLIIKHGSVQIAQAGENNTIMLATLGTGAHFGEMSFLDGEPRSATARAMERSEIVLIRYDALRKLLDAHPSLAVKFYRALAQYLGSRLRATSSDLNFARSRKR